MKAQPSSFELILCWRDGHFDRSNYPSRIEAEKQANALMERLVKPRWWRIIGNLPDGTFEHIVHGGEDFDVHGKRAVKPTRKNSVHT